jgi:ribosomal protein S19
VWRLIYVFKKKKGHKYYEFLRKTRVPIFSRKSNIPKCFIGMNVSVHKGSVFRKLFVDNLTSGYKFGEFGFTRKLYFYPLKKKYRRLERR